MSTNKKQMYVDDLMFYECRRIQENTFKKMGMMPSDREITRLAGGLLIGKEIEDLILLNDKNNTLPNKLPNKRSHLDLRI